MEKGKIVYYSIVKKEDINVGNLETKQAIFILNKQLKKLNLDIPEIFISSSGKPYFKKSNYFFNYSHSKKYIACAISTYEVGIDIEETNRLINDDIAKKYLEGVADNEERIESWVKKESYSKLNGLGLQIKFQNIKLNEIKEKNLFIKNKEYMCSIYCDSDDAEFKELIFDGGELL